MDLGCRLSSSAPRLSIDVSGTTAKTRPVRHPRRAEVSLQISLDLRKIGCHEQLPGPGLPCWLPAGQLTRRPADCAAANPHVRGGPRTNDIRGGRTST